MKKLKIAILAPVTREVSHDTRGGRNRVIFDLIEELTKQKHNVTLFGTGDSKTKAKLIPVIPKGLYNLPPFENLYFAETGYLVNLMKKIIESANKFDIIHNHCFPEFLPLLVHPQLPKTPMLTTIHLRLTKDSLKIFSLFKNEHIAQASKFQAQKTKNFKHIYVVPHGININEYKFNPRPKNHFLVFSRLNCYTNNKGQVIHPKGIPNAIRAAELAKENLILAGNCEKQEYFDTYIKPHLGKKIKFIGPQTSIGGPIGFKQKIKLYQNARALLFPLQEDETFGLTMIEAMACGTPVIAFPRATTPEIIKDGITGFLVKNENQMARAMKNIDKIDRQKCREHVEKYYTSERMANDYEKLYHKIITTHKKS